MQRSQCEVLLVFMCIDRRCGCFLLLRPSDLLIGATSCHCASPVMSLRVQNGRLPTTPPPNNDGYLVVVLLLFPYFFFTLFPSSGSCQDQIISRIFFLLIVNCIFVTYCTCQNIRSEMRWEREEWVFD